MSETFPPEAAASIVAHMNEDHADAVLAIARVQGGVPEAASARMIAIETARIDIEIDAVEGADGVPDETGGGKRTVAIALDPPIAPLDTVRARLVTMTREARQALASG